MELGDWEALAIFDSDVQIETVELSSADDPIRSQYGENRILGFDQVRRYKETPYYFAIRVDDLPTSCPCVIKEDCYT